MLYFTLFTLLIFYFTLLYFTLLYFTLLHFTLLYFTLLYFTLLQFSCHSVAVVLTPVQTKQIRKIYLNGKRQTTQYKQYKTR